MWNKLIQLSTDRKRSYQRQLIKSIVSAILDSKISVNTPLPSSRELAKQLGIARNTVVYAYQQLIDDGYLIARERSGYFVNKEILTGRIVQNHLAKRTMEDDAPSGLSAKIKIQPSLQRSIQKPKNWNQYPYPFLYGQLDANLFPIQGWRDCCRQALSVSDIKYSISDQYDADDALLIDQIQARLLSRRGVWATPSQILITMGTQQALYILCELLVDNKTVVGIENPGYVDARNIFALKSEHIKPLAVDDNGLVLGQAVNRCDLIYVTPSHQFPTTVTLSIERRKQLLKDAKEHDFMIIEDDYESEINFAEEATPTLKSMDENNRVIYVGSLSKTLAAGLRMGYMVAPKLLIHEARAIRKLMIRHPPMNNQRLVSLFLSMGHHDSLLRKLRENYQKRWEIMGESLNKYLPKSTKMPSFGGTAFWVEGAKQLDTKDLELLARKQGILIEPGDIFFINSEHHKNFFRLGYSSISEDKIDAGLKRLSQLMDTLM